MYQTNRWSVRGERRPINYLWLAFLLVGLSAAAYAATGTSVPVNVSVSIWSSDGAILAGGSGGNLITVAGTWTFDPVVSAAHPGNYSIKLNGVFQGGSPGADPSAANLYIFNNGILYQQTAANTWYSWTGAGPWSASPVADPRPGVIASIAPTTEASLPAPARQTPLSQPKSPRCLLGLLSPALGACQEPMPPRLLLAARQAF
jgi:hypothetical protein